MSRRAGAGVVLVVALAAVGATWWATTRDDPVVLSESVPAPGALGDAAPADIRFVVPAGTHDRIAAGEEVDIVPRVLQAEVGEVIEVVNEDDRTAQVGVFIVGPGQTVRQRFTSPGTLEGICEVHPDGVFTIEVVAAT